MAEGLSKHQIEIITATVLREQRKIIRKQKRDERSRNLRNTELLIKNYTKLKDLCDETIQEVIPVDYPEFDLEHLTLESLSVYRKKTMKMMNHVDRMLVAYEWNCKQGSIEEQRRYKILKLRYLSDQRLPVKQIVELHNVDQSTVYRDTKNAIKDMSVLLFGIDAIDFL